MAGNGVDRRIAVPRGSLRAHLLRGGFGIGGAPFAEGARTSVYLATADSVRTATGQYFIDRRPVQPSAHARDERLAEALWQASTAALEPFLAAPPAV